MNMIPPTFVCVLGHIPVVYTRFRLCKTCMDCNLHGWYLYVHMSLCGLQEWYYIDASLCFARLISLSLSTCSV